ncbi:hypothetical protein BJ973_008092 [Actinoplanes tereljensis]|uniref:Bacteriocin biosynthesis cyclodehydratase domain-containing protein n=1 Tax=Paractinoplanes tereljensis TaxID=571912 RepID=A0A919NUK7_9ACTN|nr:hypothetical protein [Actinoplanes tereljensis]GIF24613.1 hypothetical protein Ate02nite_73430 [Actinoplanes tereljensis]
MIRPTLIPGLPRLWCADGQLQLGSDPARALRLRLPDPRAAEILDLLDGTRTERLILLRAAELGIPPDECRSLLATLQDAGLVLPRSSLRPPADRLAGEAAALALHGAGPPAEFLRRRHASRVVLAGHGRLGAGIAVALAEAGVGHLQPDLSGAVRPGELAGGPLRASDIGKPRREAIVEAMTRAAPNVLHGVRRTTAALLVQLDHDQPVSLLAAALSGRRQPHLAVTIRHGSAVIGPLVPATGGPCLNCLALHRRDRDAEWPDPPGTAATVPEPCTVTTLLAATAFAAAEVLTFLDGGDPQTAGATVEITGPGRVRRRTWTPHPACSCARP